MGYKVSNEVRELATRYALCESPYLRESGICRRSRYTDFSFLKDRYERS